ANDLDLLGKAFATFKACTDRPTLIIVDSHIAWGSPHKHDSSAAHGEPLGEGESRLTKAACGWHQELGGRRPSVRLLRQAPLARAERLTVRGARVVLVGRSPGDVAVDDDERRAVGAGLEGREGLP